MSTFMSFTGLHMNRRVYPVEDFGRRRLLCLSSGQLRLPLSLCWKVTHPKPVTGFPGGASGKESVCQCRRHKRCHWTQVQSLGQEDTLEELMATHSSILASRIPWTEETGRLQSIGFQRVRHDWSDLAWMHKASKTNRRAENPLSLLQSEGSCHTLQIWKLWVPSLLALSEPNQWSKEFTWCEVNQTKPKRTEFKDNITDPSSGSPVGCRPLRAGSWFCSLWCPQNLAHNNLCSGNFCRLTDC